MTKASRDNSPRSRGDFFVVAGIPARRRAARPLSSPAIPALARGPAFALLPRHGACDLRIVNAAKPSDAAGRIERLTSKVSALMISAVRRRTRHIAAALRQTSADPRAVTNANIHALGYG
jgi:hypothetical protein